MKTNTNSRFTPAVIFFVGILFFMLSFSFKAYATDGVIDQTFNSNGSGGQAAGFNNVIQVLEVQDDGKIIVAGNFTTYDGSTVGLVVRLNDNGTIDQTFNSNGSGGQAAGFDNAVTNSDIQTDGKILFTGNFTHYDGVTVNHIVRLNTDGTLDTAFNTNIGTGFNNNTRGVMQLANGKILVGGNATAINGTAIKFMARLNADGTKDTAFITALGTGFNTTVQRFGQQSDGKIIVAGAFTTFNGQAKSYLLRLNLDGTFDSTFNVGGSGVNWVVYAIRVMSNDKILVGGDISAYNGVSTGNVFRLNANGSLDTTFNPGGAGANSEIDAVFEQPNGKVIIEGTGMSAYNGTPANYFARLNTDGTLDTTFNYGTGFNNGILNGVHGSNSIFRANGNIVVGGNFTAYNGTTGVGYILSLQTDVSNPIFSAIGIVSNNANPIYAISGNTVTLSFTSNHPLTSSTITLGGQSVTPLCVAGSGVSVNCTATLTITSNIPAADGVITFSITGTTVGGTTGPTTATTNSSSVTVTRSVPSTPTVTVTTPTNNKTPAISGTCTSGDTVNITVDIQTLSVLCASSAYTSTPTTLADGSYTISATQTDTVGNVSAAATAPLVIDDVAPTISITSPTGTIVSGATAIDGDCESGISVVISGTGFTPTSGSTTCTAGTFSFAITATANMSITAIQTDLAGNSATATASVLVHDAEVIIVVPQNQNGSVIPYPTIPVLPAPLPVPSPALIPIQNNGTLIQDAFQFNRNQKLGYYDWDIRTLQSFLNTHGSVLAMTSYGSPGNETTFFGPLTLRALIQYQTQNNITPAVGFFGPITRAFINALIRAGL